MRLVLTASLLLFSVSLSICQTDTTRSSSSFITVILDTLTVAEQVPDTLVIMGVGDVMLGTNYPSSRYLPPGDANMMIEAAPLLQSADAAFINLEGTIINSGGTAKSCKDPTKCYVFRMPERYAPYLNECGVDLVSLANNHSGDFGSIGRKRTAQILDSLGMAYAGHQNCPYAVWENDGTTYGLCAFSPNNGTIRINDYRRSEEIVTHLDSLCDIVIVSFHGGAEGPAHRHVTRKSEYYYGEHRGNVYEFAHHVIDHGADIVFGHGPHVVRGVELYKDRFIFYSLGNFCTYARFNLDGARGYAPLCEIRTDREGKFLEGKIHSFRQHGEGGPTLDPDHKAAWEMWRLTQADFPETQLTIGEMGEIRLRSSGE